MRRVSVGFVAAAMLVLALAGAPSASAQEQAAASCEPPPFEVIDTNGRTQAQVFTPDSSGELTHAQVSVLKLADGFDFVLDVRTVAAGLPTTNVLASAVVRDEDVPVGRWPIGKAMITATFARPANVVAGQSYALGISRPGPVDEHNLNPSQLAVGVRQQSECPGLGGLFIDVRDRDPFPDVAAVFAAFVDPTCGGKDATIVGTTGRDRLSGTNRRDVILALGGDDKIKAHGGEDLVCGGDGEDLIKGANGADELLGERGADRIFGGAGKDALRGGKGDDGLFGRGNDDDIKGNKGADKIVGGGANDRVAGNKGKDKLFGGGGEDFLLGGRHFDRCTGGRGDDKVAGCQVGQSL